MPTVSEITAFYDKKIPFDTKMDFDNVGLLCGSPEREVTTVLVALDITTDVIEEAATLGAELIVSHHPVIFSPLYAVSDTDATGKRVAALLRSDISAICLHTNFDRSEDGVNAVLAALLGAKVETMLDIGCIAVLEHSMSLREFLSLAARNLSAPGIRYHDAGRPVRRIALCGGAGGELAEKARTLGCDTVFTGEIKHHQWLDGREDGINLVEAGHYSTEKPATKVLAAMLREQYPALRICLSEKERCVHSVVSF